MSLLHSQYIYMHIFVLTLIYQYIHIYKVESHIDESHSRSILFTLYLHSQDYYAFSTKKSRTLKIEH